MKGKPEKLHFYCDKCGFEVPQDADECPECGCSFEAVRCPVCGFNGELEVFSNGCPQCGYSAPLPAPPEPASKSPPQPPPLSRPPARPRALLPLWVYIVTAVVFVSVIALLCLTVVSPASLW
ncbi:MAG: zinc ribbon domain-containing protein [Spirochaetaceae bacterium]|nr:zinc ribbon domain-containing protein [Spirochaetaceae bacterium]